MIDGVKIIKLKKISDSRGAVIRMLRKDDKYFKKFGEIYFSLVNYKKIKAWHLHKKMQLNYSVIFGQIILVLYDSRKKSKTFNKVQEIILKSNSNKLIIVPPLIWNGFMGLSKKPAIIANCATLPYDKNEILREAVKTKNIPYNWRKK